MCVQHLSGLICKVCWWPVSHTHYTNRVNIWSLHAHLSVDVEGGVRLHRGKVSLTVGSRWVTEYMDCSNLKLAHQPLSFCPLSARLPFSLLFLRQFGSASSPPAPQQGQLTQFLFLFGRGSVLLPSSAPQVRRSIALQAQRYSVSWTIMSRSCDNCCFANIRYFGYTDSGEVLISVLTNVSA